jgi:hypothetical protein
MPNLQKSLSSDSFPGPLNDSRSATTAAGGTSITSTLTVAQVIPFPNGTEHVSVQPWNFSTAVVAQMLLCPYLWIVKGTSVLSALPTITDFSSQGQQPAGTGVTLSSLDTLANGQAFYLGANVPFAGVAVKMSASVNSNASVLLVEYWNGTAWVSLSATDNTASGGSTFAQDGLVTWTMPAAGAWAKARFSNTLLYAPTNPPNPPATLDAWYPDQMNQYPQYWTRWTVSAALDSSTVATTMLALNQSTAYTEILPNNVLEFRAYKRHGGVSALQCKSDAGTYSLIMSVFTSSPFDVF